MSDLLRQLPFISEMMNLLDAGNLSMIVHKGIMGLLAGLLVVGLSAWMAFFEVLVWRSWVHNHARHTRSLFSPDADQADNQRTPSVDRLL